MGSWRFVLSRRWALFALAVLLAAYAAWWLGNWQFGRLHDRKANNAIIRTNEQRDPTPVAEVLTGGRLAGKADEWRKVTATGTYDVAHTVVVRYQTREAGAGVDVVVPLVTADGTALLVDRGWVETDPSGADRGDAPQPPSGQVTVTGYLRQNGTGSSTSVDDLSTRAISSVGIGTAIGEPVYGGFIDLTDETPPPTTKLDQGVELPELDNGPHFFYGLQWWFFGLLALFGFFYLMYDEKVNGRRGTRPGDIVEVKDKKVRQSNHPYVRARQEAEARARAAAQSGRDDPPSTESIAPVTYDAAGDSRKAAARPNSSGSP